MQEKIFSKAIAIITLYFFLLTPSVYAQKSLKSILTGKRWYCISKTCYNGDNKFAPEEKTSYHFYTGYDFKSNGRFTLISDTQAGSGTWEVKGNKLTVKKDNISTEYTYIGSYENLFI